MTLRWACSTCRRSRWRAASCGSTLGTDPMPKLFSPTRSAPVVLQGSGHDLRRAGAEAVDQHRHRHAGERVAGPGAVGPLHPVVAPAREHNQVAPPQELLRHLDRRRQQPARIAAQIQHQGPGPLLFERCPVAACRIVGRLRRTGASHVADGRRPACAVLMLGTLSTARSSSNSFNSDLGRNTLKHDFGPRARRAVSSPRLRAKCLRWGRRRSP